MINNNNDTDEQNINDICDNCDTMRKTCRVQTCFVH